MRKPVMAEIPDLIQRLHTRYEKLVSHDWQKHWQKHRTLVIVIEGFHRVVISFHESGSIVVHRYRESGKRDPYIPCDRLKEETPEIIFDVDDSKLYGKLIRYIESEVPEDEWERWPPVKVLSIEDEKELDELMKKIGMEEDECST